MNKNSVIIFLSLCLIVFTGIAVADNSSVGASGNMTKIDNAFKCLSEQVKSDCSGVNKIQDISLVILASSPNTSVTQKCYDKLMNMTRGGNCFGDSKCNVKDTAFAIIALNHVGENVSEYVSWLENQSKSANKLVWYLQQDSVGASKCSIEYNSQSYNFNVLENKKLSGNVGNCISLANSNYWLQISPNCYNTTFKITCDSEGGFIASLSYKQSASSPVLFVLAGTQSAQPSDSIELSIKSKCFGDSDCDYESTAWAALALDMKQKDISQYLPYLMAEEDSNKKFLPAAFIYKMRDFNDYGAKLVQQQKAKYWEADGTAYNKYYDTGLAILALSNRNQDKIKDSRDWLLSSQGAEGCWNNKNIRDTAMVLWALEGRMSGVTPRTSTSSLSDCIQSGFFCKQSPECPSDELLPNYHCGSLMKCCKTENLKSCSNMSGIVCNSDEECKDGIEKRASDVAKCCVGGTCGKKSPSITECEQTGGTCLNSCSSNQQETAADCENSEKVCCTVKPSQSSDKDDKGGFNLIWLWIILIILIIAILIFIFKDKIKIALFKMKSGMKEDKGGAGGNQKPFNPYSGGASMPPQRVPMRTMPMNPQPGFNNNSGFQMRR